MKRNEIITVIRSLSDTIKKNYHAEVISIFGSYARSEEKDSSDIDILVRFDDKADLFDFVGLSIFLEENLGRKVDVVPHDAVRPELKEIILKEAIPV